MLARHAGLVVAVLGIERADVGIDDLAGRIGQDVVRPVDGLAAAEVGVRGQLHELIAGRLAEELVVDRVGHLGRDARKGAVADALDLRSDRKARQSVAAVEGQVGDLGDAVGQHVGVRLGRLDGREAFAIHERAAADRLEVAGAVLSRRKLDGRQTGAAAERICGHGDHACGDGDGAERRAVVVLKRIGADIFEAVGKRDLAEVVVAERALPYLLDGAALGESEGTDAVAIVEHAVGDVLETGADRDRSEIAAVLERVLADLGERVGEHELRLSARAAGLEVGTALERARADLFERRRQLDSHKPRAIGERALGDLLQRVGQADVGQLGVVLEHAFFELDLRDVLAEDHLGDRSVVEEALFDERDAPACNARRYGQCGVFALIGGNCRGVAAHGIDKPVAASLAVRRSVGVDEIAADRYKHDRKRGYHADQGDVLSFCHKKFLCPFCRAAQNLSRRLLL